MNSLYVAAVILAASTVVSLVKLLIAKDMRGRLCACIMLACPVVGPLFFLGSWFFDKVDRSKADMQMSDISFDKSRRERIMAPDFDAEIQTVPLEETFLISGAAEKRRRLLSELKKERIENYTTLMKALEDNDPETSHYAATAIVNAKTEFENNLRELDNLYGNPDAKSDNELLRRYGDYLMSFLKSGILSEIERKKYSRLYIHVLTTAVNAQELLTPEDYAHIVDEALSLSDYSLAEEWAHRALEAHKTEKTYLILMKFFYRTAQSERLMETMDALRASRIPLSGEGLEAVRFFMIGRRRKK